MRQQFLLQPRRQARSLEQEPDQSAARVARVNPAHQILGWLHLLPVTQCREVAHDNDTKAPHLGAVEAKAFGVEHPQIERAGKNLRDLGRFAAPPTLLGLGNSSERVIGKAPHRFLHRACSLGVLIQVVTSDI